MGGWQGQPVGGLGHPTPERPSQEQRIREWIRKLESEGASFTPHGTLLKIEEELVELRKDPDDPFEVADIIIAAIAYSVTKGWSISRYVAEKMDINEARTWAIQPDGSFHHV
jgi:hypothetical protein